METPETGRLSRPVRHPTPRLSERKKSLFPEPAGPRSDEDDLLAGINVLDTSQEEPGQLAPIGRITRQSVSYALSGATARTPPSVSDAKNEYSKMKPATTRRSLRLDHKNSSSQSQQIEQGNGKENIPLHATVDEGNEAQLQLLFSKSMKLSVQSIVSKPTSENAPRVEASPVETEKEPDSNNPEGRFTNKRSHDPCTSPELAQKQPKIVKIAPSKLESLTFSTKSFYSSDIKTSPGSSNSSKPMYRRVSSDKQQTPRSRRSHPPSTIKKGVHHKIQRRLLPPRYSSSIDIDLILSNLRNEKLRNLIKTQSAQKIQIEKVHKILRDARNPIEMARPLSSLGFTDDSNNNKVDPKHGVCEADFSDIELSESDSSDDDSIIPPIKHRKMEVDEAIDAPAHNRKFFKSDRANRTRKEITITANIRASVVNGKISLMEHKKKRPRKSRSKQLVSNAFSAEQATVNEILKNLNDTTFGDVPNMPTVNKQINEQCNANEKEKQPDKEFGLEHHNEEKLNDNYSDFRQRLPYNTSDPQLIKQQHLLLEFLISNDICTEENFVIFIADPDNHKPEASRIVDQLVMVVAGSSEFRQRIPYNTSNPDVIEQQHLLLDFLIENNICTEENFDIFIANNESRHAEAEAIVDRVQTQAQTDYQQPSADDVPHNSAISLPVSIVDEDNIPSCSTKTSTTTAPERHRHPAIIVPTTPEPAVRKEKQTGDTDKLFPIFYTDRYQPLFKEPSRRSQQRIWSGGHGVDQLQIDAGQKNFGAHQCKQCGLTYTVHEPEEEQLHRDFHASVHVLRFKGWIDEDLIAVYREWGSDLRILRLNECAPVRRRDRLMEVLNLVDKELGLSSYILPPTFVAFFAVHKHQIVGVCLAQPLTKANKYLVVNGVECCTEDEFPTRCGISRIWVSPLLRRLHIATKLMHAVQSNTVLGEEILLHEIAFSAPTELGKRFVQSITKTEHFLVYQ